MVEKAERKISLEVKNTVTSEITGVNTVQCAREADPNSNGDDKQATGYGNSKMTTQSHSNASPAEKVMVDVITGSPQAENTHSHVESKKMAPQTYANLPVIAKGNSSSSEKKVIPQQVTNSSIATNALVTATGTPLESSSQSQKQQTVSDSVLYDPRRDQKQSKSQPPPTSNVSTKPVKNALPVIERERAFLPVAKTLEGPVSNGVVSQNSKVAPPNQQKAPATIINAGQLPAMTSKIPPKGPLPNAVSENDTTVVVEDVIQKLRSPLVNTYGSFIHPTDTSLADARKRLETALEQTRVLRAAFTDRVYEKYRVLLRPVPKSIHQIVGKIRADPGAANLSILEEIRILKEEKETEKKEAQLAAAASLGSGDGAAASAALTASSIETAEQLSYISAGLNLVILPEDEISEHDLALLRFEHRGPTNPETGQRVPGISAAAVTAAEVLLDRVRRACSLRTDRQKRRQIKSPPGEMSAAAPVEVPAVNPILSRIHLMSSGSTSSPTPMTVHTAPIDSSVTLKATKNINTGKPNPAFLSPTMMGKSGRARPQPPASAANLLSLNPAAEEIQFDEVNMASTKALIAQGVGNTYQPRSAQNRHRHPHPSSLGGRSAGTQSCVKIATIGTDALGHTIVGLPTLPVGEERRLKKAVKTADRSAVSKDRVLTCLNSILVQFASVDETGFDTRTKGKAASMAMKKELASSIVHSTIGDSICETPSFTQRRTTEIGLLRGMQHSSEGGNRSTDGSFLSVNPFDGALGISTAPAAKVATEIAEEDHPVEPVLAFSVLHALGLVCDTPNSRYDQCQSRDIMSQIEFSFAGKGSDGGWPGGSTKLKALCQRITRKKRRFTEVFFAAAGKAEDNSPAKRFKKSAPILQPEPPLIENCEGEIIKSVSLVHDPFVAVEAQSLVETVSQVSKADPRGSGDVLSIRGGGGEDFADLDDNDGDRLGRTNSGKKRRLEPREVEATDKPNVEDQTEAGPKNSPIIPSGDNSSSSVQRTSSLPPSYDSILDMEPRPPNQSAPTVISKFSGSATFSPSRNNTALIAAARQHQAALAQRTVNQAIAATQEGFHHSTSALHLQGSLQHASLNMMHGHHGNMSDFFGGLHAPAQRGPYGSLTDWSQIDAANAAVGLLPAHSSLAMGLHQQHAAMVNLSVDRARALLAREHQNAAVAAAQRQAAARATAGVVGLSPQQAAMLMGQSGGAALFQSTSNRFSHVGTHSAASILSSQSAVMMNQGSSLGAQIQAMQRAAGSRPGSSSSVISARGTSRPSSAKGRTKVSKEDKPLEDTAIGKSEDYVLGVDQSSKKKRKTTERPPSSSSASRHEKMDQSKSTSKIPAETNNNATETIKLDGEHEAKLSAQSSMPDQQTKSTVVAPAAILCDKEDVAVETIASKSVRTEQRDFQNQPPEIPGYPETADKAKSLSESLPPVTVLTAGMQFFPPNTPDLVTPEMATDVLEARVHNAARRATDRNSRALLEFVQSVGSAVPIPKALVSHLLKERFASAGFKVLSGNNSPSIPREVVAATVLIWLWVQHKESFQRAFAKSGRIDVDPECKWLIQAAVDAAIRALAAELSLMAQKAQVTVTAEGREKGAQDSVAKAELQVASTVSKALMTEMCIDEDIDEILPVFDDLVDLLDEARMCALRSKCSERSLLATLVARSVTMSEVFSHAYVSSMVRAGEALGHGELFELAQDEETCTTTMIPYDIFSDEHGAWEDPCRLPNGFMPGLTGEDLMRRAHARAMIQKSLKKMQDRNNIRGGAQNSGPYADPAPLQSPAGSASNVGLTRGLQRTPTGSFKKKSSFTFSGDATNPGSGSAPAKSMTQYNPTHTSIPLFWDGDLVENTPYGKFVKGPRPRAFSMTKAPMIRGGRDANGGRDFARTATTSTIPTPATAEDIAGAAVRSTEEVEWVDVAEIFETVNLEGTSSVKKSRKSAHHRPSPHGSKKIIAPFCRRLEVPLPEDDDEESDLDEDLRDENILTRHREVLDVMKEKLDKVMENRPLTAQQRARNRAEARRNASMEGAS